MKRAAMALLAFMIAQPAHAIIPVIDELAATYHELQLTIAQSELAQAIKSVVVETKQYATELEELARVESMLQSMVQHPSLGQAQAMMGMLGVGNPLGGIGSVYSLMAMTSGFNNGLGSIAGKLGQLGSIMSSIGSTNSVYRCTDDTDACRIQTQRANANAGYQGILGKLYTDLSSHYEVLRGLRDRQSTATDPAERENLMIALNSEQAWATSALGQMQAASALYQAQRDANVNRADELFSSSVKAFGQKAGATQ
jgi:hypothetical protein